jgi:deoxyribonuclease V
MASNRYNRAVRLKHIPDWNLSIPAAKNLQNKLAFEVCRTGSVTEPRLIAGIDVSIQRFRKTGTAAVVVLNYPELTPVEIKTVDGIINFPYVPGLLTFREAPLIIQAVEQLENTPDLIMMDGQGVAHPRRLGVAAHLGLIMDIPTIGVAKSRLCGVYEEPAPEAGNFTELTDDHESIGMVVRTKSNVKPLFVSIGNKISIEEAVYWVMNCCRGYRLPEPTRLAHLAAGGNLKIPGNV